MLLLSSFRGSAEVKRIVTQRLRRMEKRSHQIGPRPGTTQAESSCPREAALRTVNEGNVPGALWDQDLSLGCSSATGSPSNSRRVALLVSPTSCGDQGMCLLQHLGLSLPAMGTRSKEAGRGLQASRRAGVWQGVGWGGRQGRLAESRESCGRGRGPSLGSWPVASR